MWKVCFHNWQLIRLRKPRPEHRVARVSSLNRSWKENVDAPHLMWIAWLSYFSKTEINQLRFH